MLSGMKEPYWSVEQGRSAKAINQTADMNVREKSDCAVVPVNQPNNEGQPFAEAGERRAQIEENTVQSHMRPTQSGKRISQGLHGVRQAAKERKQERFTALLHHLSVGLLRDSFYTLQRKASPGVDGVTWQEYETGLEDRLVDLHRRVHRGAYRAKPSRRVYIPKTDGRQRPMGTASSSRHLSRENESFLNLAPTSIGIELAHCGCRFSCRRPQILLEQHAILVDDEGHYS
jgi:hypothetical protein